MFILQSLSCFFCMRIAFAITAFLGAANAYASLCSPSGLNSWGPISSQGGYASSWGAVSGATYYRLRTGDGREFSVNGTSATKDTLGQWVQACNSSGCSGKAYFNGVGQGVCPVLPSVTLSFSPSTIQEGGTAFFQWQATDATSCSGSGLTGISGLSGLVSYKAPVVMSSNSTLTVTVVCNGTGGTVSQTALLKIDWINDYPVVSTIADRSIALNGTTGNISFSISDEETSTNNLQLSAVSNNTALVPASGILLSGSGSVRNISVTPRQGERGSALISVRVSDGHNSVTRAFSVTVGGGITTPVTKGYSYDALGRLKKLHVDGALKSDYEYDPAGNRKNVTDN